MAPPPDRERLGEFDIIAHFFAPLATDPASLGLTDDAALLRGGSRDDLVVTTDTLIDTVHFLPGDPPEAIGHKALAVSLSDLAAKGAEPIAYLLALSLPEDDSLMQSPEWLEGLAKGLEQLQEEAGAALIGGDTTGTPGPLTLTITAIGRVPEGQAVLRSRAKPSDGLYVSGTIGDAALGLRLLRYPSLAERWGLSEDEAAYLVNRYREPHPRTTLAPALRHHANGAIDLSDGLGGDLDKLCIASGLQARVEASRVPLSEPATKACQSDPALLPALLGGGDDYEILAAIPANRSRAFEIDAERAGVRVTRIGSVDAGPPTTAVFIGADGAPMNLERRSFSHF
ncbi:thiamine-phosphate kinase [Methyloligella solikamskensis]|uniref:Thiamine-monophosphate kinase n=1 Tax=Methyloligella solikamskensis TaxID=1177756 RepID=A0ABW3JAL7_9HYPH